MTKINQVILIKVNLIIDKKQISFLQNINLILVANQLAIIANLLKEAILIRHLIIAIKIKTHGTLNFNLRLAHYIIKVIQGKFANHKITLWMLKFELIVLIIILGISLLIKK